MRFPEPQEIASLNEVREALCNFEVGAEVASLPSAVRHPVVVLDGEDRPQPRRDVYAGDGMSAVVGRVRECPILDIKLTLLSHDLVRGAAGAALLNAELLAARGFLKSPCPRRRFSTRRACSAVALTYHSTISHWESRAAACNSKCEHIPCAHTAKLFAASGELAFAPPNEMMIAITRFVASVTIVRSIARRAAVWPKRIAKYRQSFQIQIVFPDSLIRFPRAPRAEHDVALHVRQIIKSHRQPALDGYKVDHIHHIIYPRQSLPRNHPPQQRFRRPAISRRILPQRLVPRPRRQNRRRLQHRFRLRELQYLSSQIRSSWAKGSCVAPTSTSAVTHASATRGHLSFNSASIVTIGTAPPLMLN